MYVFHFILHAFLDFTTHRYYASLSGALAILNLIPCYFLDGQWALLAFIEYFLPTLVKRQSVRATIYHVTLLLGSTLLLVNIFYGLWNLRGEGILSLGRLAAK